MPKITERRLPEDDFINEILDFIQKSDINQSIGPFGEKYIHYACYYGYNQALSLLLENGADPNIEDNLGNTPIFTAAGLEHQESIKLLVETGQVDPNKRLPNGQTMLHLAVLKDKPKTIEALLMNGANILAPDSKGITPLLLAVQMRISDTVDYFLEFLIGNNALSEHRERINATFLANEKAQAIKLLKKIIPNDDDLEIILKYSEFSDAEVKAIKLEAALELGKMLPLRKIFPEIQHTKVHDDIIAERLLALISGNTPTTDSTDDDEAELAEALALSLAPLTDAPTPSETPSENLVLETTPEDDNAVEMCAVKKSLRMEQKSATEYLTKLIADIEAGSVEISELKEKLLPAIDILKITIHPGLRPKITDGSVDLSKLKGKLVKELEEITKSASNQAEVEIAKLQITASSPEEEEFIKKIENHKKTSSIDEAINFLGETLIHIAASYGFSKALKILLAYGANPLVKLVNGNTPLQLAFWVGHQDVIDILLADSRVDINAPIDEQGYTLLDHAAGQGNLDVVARLLDNNASQEPKNDSSNSPIYIAAYSGNIQTVEFFLRKYGIDINSNDNKHKTTLLHLATLGNTSDMVTFLIDNEANILAKDVNGDTPLDLASKKKKYDIVKLLIKTLVVKQAKETYNASAAHQSKVIEIEEKSQELIKVISQNNDKTVQLKAAQELAELLPINDIFSKQIQDASSSVEQEDRKEFAGKALITLLQNSESSATSSEQTLESQNVLSGAEYEIALDIVLSYLSDNRQNSEEKSGEHQFKESISLLYKIVKKIAQNDPVDSELKELPYALKILALDTPELLEEIKTGEIMSHLKELKIDLELCLRCLGEDVPNTEDGSVSEILLSGDIINHEGNE